jgi:hypothetical protein
MQLALPSMHMDFLEERLQRACCTRSEMTRRWGPAWATILGQRLFEIWAAASLAELERLPHLALRVLEARAEGIRVALPVVDELRIVFEAKASLVPDACAEPERWDLLTEALILHIGTEDRED